MFRVAFGGLEPRVRGFGVEGVGYLWFLRKIAGGFKAHNLVFQGVGPMLEKGFSKG